MCFSAGRVAKRESLQRLYLEDESRSAGVDCEATHVITDVVATFDKFTNLMGAPLKARTDLEPSLPDLKIKITDAVYAIEAFTGGGYPFEGIIARISVTVVLLRLMSAHHSISEVSASPRAGHKVVGAVSCVHSYIRDLDHPPKAEMSFVNSFF